MKAAAIIAAGGSGERFGGGRKKQYVHLRGRSILEWSLHPLLVCDDIHEIIVVVPAEDVDSCSNEVAAPLNTQKLVFITTGGRVRQESVLNGLKILSPEIDIVLIHDAVRPFITSKMLEEGIYACRETGSVIFAVPEVDTVIQVDNRTITEVLDREHIWRVQTPQIFYRDIIIEAFQKAEEEGLTVTDESSLVRNAGHPVKVICGSYDNIKITIPEDLKIAETILHRRTELLF